MRSMRILAALALAAVAAQADGIEWDFEGYPTIRTAAQQAKTSGKRLLLGLSGAPT